MSTRRDLHTAERDWRRTNTLHGMDLYAATGGRAYKPPVKYRSPMAWVAIDLGFLALGLFIGIVTTAIELGAI